LRSTLGFKFQVWQVSSMTEKRLSVSLCISVAYSLICFMVAVLTDVLIYM
jgi:hypothetical protein